MSSAVLTASTRGYAGPALDQTLLQAARLWITLERPYYASVLYRCPIVATDTVPTFATDRTWRIYINPVHANRLSVEAFAAELVHEVNHLIRDHCARARLAPVHTADDHRRWNLAADAEINDDLLADGLAVDDTWVLPDTLGQPKDLTAEVYYAAITPDPANLATSRDAERPGDDGRDGRDERHEQDPGCGDGAGGRPVPGGLDVDDPSAPAVLGMEAEVIRTQVAHDVVAHLRGRGQSQGALFAWAMELLQPSVDWRRVLAGVVRNAVAVTAGQADFSYRRFSRRSTQVPDVRLPGMIQRTPEVAVVVDTSGSMRDEDVQQALTEVQSILRSASVAEDRVTVLTVDAAIGEIRRVSDARSVSRMGRGGTDMRVGITAALRLRPRPDIVVVLTDGETPWPERRPARAQVVAGLIGNRLADLGGLAPPSWIRAVEIPATPEEDA
jgi:predicted metal-dependent peptidase